MLKQITLLLAIYAVPLPAFSAPNPFAGTWKFNQEKSDLKGQLYTIASLGDNKFRFKFGNVMDFTIKADGTDQTSIPGATWALTIKDPNTWEQVNKTNGIKPELQLGISPLTANPSPAGLRGSDPTELKLKARKP